MFNLKNYLNNDYKRFNYCLNTKRTNYDYAYFVYSSNQTAV